MTIFPIGQMYLIKRFKRGGLGFHWGVMSPYGWVAEYTIDGDLRICSIEEFSAGIDIAIERLIPRNEWRGVYQRLDELKRSPRRYDLLQWNCETFARWLVGEPPRSEQIRGLIGLAGLALAFKLCT